MSFTRCYPLCYPSAMNISDEMRDWRTREGISQEKAAKAMRVTLSTYSKWEQGVRTPSEKAAERFLRIASKNGKGRE